MTLIDSYRCVCVYMYVHQYFNQVIKVTVTYNICPTICQLNMYNIVWGEIYIKYDNFVTLKVKYPIHAYVGSIFDSK